MNKSKRKVVIAGNWKMNKTPSEAAALIEELKPIAANADCDVVICVPYVDLPKAVELCAGSGVKVGAQNVHFEKSGAFTGEISADMLCELKVSHVVIGHSERRQYFGETDETVCKRATASVNAGLVAIVCVGETLADREAGITEELIALQVKRGLSGFTADMMKNVVIAYEPVWAIGTGVTATDEQAQEICAFIRSKLTAMFGEAVAEATTIQYGGSMNPKNAASLLGMTDIDGGLIGGASLKSADFAVIVEAGSAK